MFMGGNYLPDTDDREVEIARILTDPVVAQEGQRLTRGPYLQALLSGSVKVIWLTSLPAVGKVRFRIDDGAAREI